jgi:hypothetical protein
LIGETFSISVLFSRFLVFYGNGSLGAAKFATDRAMAESGLSRCHNEMILLVCLFLRILVSSGT